MKEKTLTSSKAEQRTWVLSLNLCWWLAGVLLFGSIFFHIAYKLLVYEPQLSQSFPNGHNLVLLTIDSPISYTNHRSNHPNGFQYDVLKAFAQTYNLHVEVRSVQSQAQMLEELKAGRGDLGAAILSLNDEDKEQFLMGPYYGSVEIQLICNYQVKPKQIENLSNVNVFVSKGSAEERMIQRISEYNPDLHWQVNSNLTSEEILRHVNAGKIDCTITDAITMKYYRRILLNLRMRLNLGEHPLLTWVLPKHSYLLGHLIEKWFNEMENSPEISRLVRQYYSHINEFDYSEFKTFLAHSHYILPQYRRLFTSVAEEVKIDWRLIAAVAYQESHWNPNARSMTGVRGMMMLTEDTADFLGIEDRTDTLSSIKGGAKYLKYLLDKIPHTVSEKERTWMALAAYNIGPAHMRDASRLARKLSKRPESWQDMKQVLPLLTQEKHYKDLRHGFARGHEPVSFVDRIRNYYEVLNEIYPD